MRTRTARRIRPERRRVWGRWRRAASARVGEQRGGERSCRLCRIELAATGRDDRARQQDVQLPAGLGTPGSGLLRVSLEDLSNDAEVSDRLPVDGAVPISDF